MGVWGEGGGLKEAGVYIAYVQWPPDRCTVQMSVLEILLMSSIRKLTRSHLNVLATRDLLHRKLLTDGY